MEDIESMIDENYKLGSKDSVGYPMRKSINIKLRADVKRAAKK